MQQYFAAADFAAFAPSGAGHDSRPFNLFSPPLSIQQQQQQQQQQQPAASSSSSAFGWSHIGLWESGAGSDTSGCTTPEKADSGVGLSPHAPPFNFGSQASATPLSLGLPSIGADATSPLPILLSPDDQHLHQQQQLHQLQLQQRAGVAVSPSSQSPSASAALAVGSGRPRPKQAKPGIGHEIDRWIASVTCSAPIAGPGLSPQGPNNIVLDKNTLLNFLSKLKMYHQKKREMKIELCVFCRQNQEPFSMYTGHRLTDALGNVTCPVLFQYECPICHATGAKAHTIKYCPLGNGLLSGEACLRTERNSVGRTRR